MVMKREKKKRGGVMISALLLAGLLFTACGSEETAGGENIAAEAGEENAAAADAEDAAASADDTDGNVTDVSETEDGDSGTGQVATAEDMVTPEEVVEEGMEPIYGDAVQDGVYEVVVDSSSSMFNIESCTLTVQEGEMSAVLTMGGTGYLYLYMGTAEEAAAAGEADYISFVENEEGQHTFTVPVEALDAGIDCAAFSKRKELWYDRVLCFRADSLPLDAMAKGAVATVESLGLEDGEYTVEVSLEGGSGKAGVTSPTRLTVEGGQAYAVIIWSSPNYDYMKVDGVQYDLAYEELGFQGNSAFRIPVDGFDWKMAVKADTTAMSEPHEIDYTLYFDSTTILLQQ